MATEKHYKYKVNVFDSSELTRRVVFGENKDEFQKWIEENIFAYKIMIEDIDKLYISFKYKRDFVYFKLYWF